MYLGDSLALGAMPLSFAIKRPIGLVLEHDVFNAVHVRFEPQFNSVLVLFISFIAMFYAIELRADLRADIRVDANISLRASLAECFSHTAYLLLKTLVIRYVRVAITFLIHSCLALNAFVVDKLGDGNNILRLL